MTCHKVWCQHGIGGGDIANNPQPLSFHALYSGDFRRDRTHYGKPQAIPRRLRVSAVVQQNPKVATPRKEPPWYNGKFSVLSSKLARWMTNPEQHERYASEVVYWLWTGTGNVSSLRASEAAQCVAFRAAAIRAMYGALPEVRTTARASNFGCQSTSSWSSCSFLPKLHFILRVICFITKGAM